MKNELKSVTSYCSKKIPGQIDKNSNLNLNLQNNVRSVPLMLVHIVMIVHTMEIK